MRERIIQHVPAGNQVTPRDLIEVQQRLQRYTDEIDAKPHLASFIIEGVELTSGAAVLVPHKLGRKVAGYWVIKRSANAVVWDEIDTTDEDLAQVLPLQCSADVTVDLVVF